MRVQNKEYKELHQKYNFNIEQWFICIKIGKIQFLGQKSTYTIPKEVLQCSDKACQPQKVYQSLVR